MSYETLKNYDKAMSYYRKSVEYNEQEKNQPGTARNYLGMGNVSTATYRFAEALDYYRRAEKIFRQEEWLLELSIVLNNIGNVLDEQGKYRESVAKRREALQIMTEGEDFLEASKYNCYIAGTLMKAGNFTEAAKHIQDAEKLAAGIESEELHLEIFEARARLYFGTGRYLEGNRFLTKFHELKDSLYSAELSGNIADMEVRHNTGQLRIEKAEALARNLELQQEKIRADVQRNYVIFGSLLLVLSGSLAAWIYRQRRRNREEKERLKAMLDSENAERARIAQDLHDGLGQLLSTITLGGDSIAEQLEGKYHERFLLMMRLVDQAILEMRSISHNLMPPMIMNHGLEKALESMISTIDHSSDLSVTASFASNYVKRTTSEEITIYRIVQEVITNMIRHAQASAIQLNCTFSGPAITLEISDNGKGFDTALIEQSEGMGWISTIARIRLLRGEYRIESTAEKGTRVLITFGA